MKTNIPAPAERRRPPIPVEADGLSVLCRPWSYDADVRHEVAHYFEKIRCAPDQRWLDIGGHIGWFALGAASRGCSVVACEPEPDNFLLLEQNVRRNKTPGSITALRCAVGARPATAVPFYISSSRVTMTHSLFVRRGRAVIDVEVRGVNELIEACDIDQIKCDCEGAELVILNALTPANWDRIEQLVFEYHYKMNGDRHRDKYPELVRLLRRHFKTVDCPMKEKSWLVQGYCSK